MRSTIIKTALAAAAVGLLATGAYAGADSLVTGAKVKNNSLTGLDITRIKCGDLDLPLRKSISACNGGKTVVGSNGSVTINAPKGDAGPTGPKGADGVGVNGAQGVTGPKGSSGDQGTQGVPGATGATGPEGTPGAPGANGRDGGLPNGFFVTNKSVGLTKGGVDFGPYVDGGVAGGSLYFNGLNGQKLSDIASLAYTVSHSTSNGSPISVPYLRVFLNGDADDVVLDPTECATKVPAENTANTFDTATTTVRYNDDACGASAKQLTWAEVVTAHGNDVVSGIYVTTGFAGGADLRAKLTNLKVNGTNYPFGS